MFEWHLILKDKVVLEECKYKVMPNNMEIKLRKQTNKKWGSITPISPEAGERKGERERETERKRKAD